MVPTDFDLFSKDNNASKEEILKSSLVDLLKGDKYKMEQKKGKITIYEMNGKEKTGRYYTLNEGPGIIPGSPADKALPKKEPIIIEERVTERRIIIPQETNELNNVVEWTSAIGQEEISQRRAEMDPRLKDIDGYFRYLREKQKKENRSTLNRVKKLLGRVINRG